MLNLHEDIEKKFKGKKILLAGLGLQGGGEGVAEFFTEIGAKLTITDLRPQSHFKKILKNKNAKFVFGRHRRRDFKEADIIIKNPAVPQDSPFIKYALDLGKPVLSETQIFFDIIPNEKIIGITGTKGKTTTAILLAHLLKTRFDVLIVGNIPGHSPLASLLGLKKMPDFFVYELSSFNLEKMMRSPRYAVITNIFPDHLNRYYSFGKYVKTKANIFKNQKKGDVLWLNKNDRIFNKMISKRKKIFFFNSAAGADFLKKLKPKLCFISPDSIRAAVSVASFFGVTKNVLKKRLDSFEQPKGRMEYLGKKNGVHVINDTASTNPDSAIFGLRMVKKCLNVDFSRIILIAGGDNKRLNYSSLSKIIKKLKSTILLPGTASESIRSKKVFRVPSLDKAVDAAFSEAKRGDCVFFSPAAASFNMFLNEFDRGRAFKKAVKSL